MELTGLDRVERDGKGKCTDQNRMEQNRWREDRIVAKGSRAGPTLS